MYICLRDETDLHNFPARDRWPADTLLKGFPRDGIAYLVRCYLFFAALFQALESELAPMKHLGMDGLAVWFDQEFGVYARKKRKEFFSLVEKKYNDQVCVQLFIFLYFALILILRMSRKALSLGPQIHL